MTSSNQPTMGLKRNKTGVRDAYTLENVRQDILSQRNALDEKGQLTSWRKIAKRYGVSHAAVYRIAQYGTEPKDATIRLALGLPTRAVTVTPLACGHAPLAKRCPDCQPRKTKPRTWRPAEKGIW